MNVLNAASAVKKRTKNELTLAQKWEIIQFKKENPKATQRSLCAKFGTDFNITIPTSTMSDILKPENIRKLEQVDSVENLNKRIREAKYPELEKCLYLWYSEKLSRKIPISDDMLTEKAREFGGMLGLVTFQYSSCLVRKIQKTIFNQEVSF